MVCKQKFCKINYIAANETTQNYGFDRILFIKQTIIALDTVRYKLKIKLFKIPRNWHKKNELIIDQISNLITSVNLNKVGDIF